jgi:hypothetical protein
MGSVYDLCDLACDLGGIRGSWDVWRPENKSSEELSKLCPRGTKCKHASCPLMHYISGANGKYKVSTCCATCTVAFTRPILHQDIVGDALWFGHNSKGERSGCPPYAVSETRESYRNTLSIAIALHHRLVIHILLHRLFFSCSG